MTSPHFYIAMENNQCQILFLKYKNSWRKRVRTKNVSPFAGTRSSVIKHKHHTNDAGGCLRFERSPVKNYTGQTVLLLLCLNRGILRLVYVFRLHHMHFLAEVVRYSQWLTGAPNLTQKQMGLEKMHTLNPMSKIIMAA